MPIKHFAPSISKYGKIPNRSNSFPALRDPCVDIVLAVLLIFWRSQSYKVDQYILADATKRNIPNIRLSDLRDILCAIAAPRGAARNVVDEMSTNPTRFT